MGIFQPSTLDCRFFTCFLFVRSLHKLQQQEKVNNAGRQARVVAQQALELAERERGRGRISTGATMKIIQLKHFSSLRPRMPSYNYAQPN